MIDVKHVQWECTMPTEDEYGLNPEFGEWFEIDEGRRLIDTRGSLQYYVMNVSRFIVKESH